MKKKEPLLTAALLVSAVSAFITLLIAFGLPITVDQTQALIGFVSIVAPVVVALIARGQVTPVARESEHDDI